MDTDFLKLQLRRALAQVSIYAVERDHAWPGDPEQTAGIAADVAGVVGMDGRGTPRKDLQSDEGEGAPVVLAVRAHVDSLHEPHVAAESQGIARSVLPSA